MYVLRIFIYLRIQVKEWVLRHGVYSSPEWTNSGPFAFLATTVGSIQLVAHYNCITRFHKIPHTGSLSKSDNSNICAFIRVEHGNKMSLFKYLCQLFLGCRY